SGDDTFTVDDAAEVLPDSIHGLIDEPCPPGQHLSAVTGRCEPGDSNFAFLAVAAIRALNAASGGRALPGARTLLLSDTVVPLVLSRLDANGDGRLSFQELLSANLVAVARSVAHDFRGPDVDVPIPGGDGHLKAFLRGYLDGVSADLALGIANEG